FGTPVRRRPQVVAARRASLPAYEMAAPPDRPGASNQSRGRECRGQYRHVPEVKTEVPVSERIVSDFRVSKAEPGRRPTAAVEVFDHRGERRPSQVPEVPALSKLGPIDLRLLVSEMQDANIHPIQPR